MITQYQPPPPLADEGARERAVEGCGVLQMRDDPVLQAVVDDVRRTFAVAAAALSVLHSDWQYLVAGAGVPTGPTSRRTSFCGHAIATGEPVFCVPDASLDSRFAGNPVVTEAGGVRFYAGAPLLGPERQPLGALCIFDPVPRAGLEPLEAARLIQAAARAMAVIAGRAPAAAAAATGRPGDAIDGAAGRMAAG